MTARTACPACAGTTLETLYTLRGIPAQSVVLLDTAEEARAYPSGDLALTLCRDCGFLFNAIFDASIVDYAQTTEESQHFSGTFTRFAKALVDEIAADTDLAGARVLEIGCGKGDFLTALVEKTGCEAIGIDPGFRGDGRALDPRIRFVRDYFDPSQVTHPVHSVICRHTLEHVQDVAAFMAAIMQVIGRDADVQVVFETPDVARVLSEGAFWDIYHEHCSYFTIGSHARLFRRAGLDVRHSALVYDGQYIVQYARPGSGATRPEEDDLAATLAAAAAFPAKVAQTQETWRKVILDAHRRGARTALWGGGSKAVAFLTTLGLGAEEVDQVIDVNPFKQGKFLPHTAHRVEAPGALLAAPPDQVIVMNPIYRDEIAADLAAMGLSPNVLTL